MSSTFKPQGYSTISPYLVVAGADTTINFLVCVFDAVPLRHFADTEGRVQHAEVRIGDTVIMLADGGDDWPPFPAYVHIYVPDVEETYRRALEAGAMSVQEPIKKNDPDKRCGVKDVGGTTWWIATQVE